ncbi:MAG: DUF3596 domain-containing protein, partial [Pseudomonadota bacterium]|nr:DUF3596 domain-containing protein [Pseudomonadota bacterium]
MDGKLRGIRPRKNSIQIDFTYNGIRCRETKRLPPTKANLKHCAHLRSEILRRIEIGNFNYAEYFPDSPKVRLTSSRIPKTIGKALDEYIESKRRTAEYSTWRDYRSAAEHHLKPAFGDFLITELATSDIRSWINTLEISNKRINNILVPLRGVLSDAYADGLIERN